MPRVHFVKKAKKDNAAVNKGESYYYWTFRVGVGGGRKYGGARKVVSATYPKPYQLTNSPYKQAVRSLQDNVANLPREDMFRDSYESAVEDIVNTLNEIRDEAENSLMNMPDHLQETSMTGQLLQERIDYAEQAIEEFEGLDLDELTPDERMEEIQNVEIMEA